MIIKRFYSTSRWIKQHLNDPYVKRVPEQQSRLRKRTTEAEQHSNYNKSILNTILYNLNIKYQIQDLHLEVGVNILKEIQQTLKQWQLIFFLYYLHHSDGYYLREDQKLISKIIKQYTSFDLIVSDIAPSTTGNQDHQEEIELNRMCAFTASKLLKNKGSMVMKTFIGPFSKQLVHSLQYFFEEVHKFKPKASRSSSFEQFIICLKLKEERRSKISKLLLMEYTGKLSKPQIHRLLQ